MNITNDQWNIEQSVRNEIIYTIEISKSNLCDLNDACILVRETINVVAAHVNKAAFKSCAP